MLASNSGVCLPLPPTITRVVKTGTLLRKSCSSAVAVFTSMRSGGIIVGSQRTGSTFAAKVSARFKATSSLRCASRDAADFEKSNVARALGVFALTAEPRQIDSHINAVIATVATILSPQAELFPSADLVRMPMIQVQPHLFLVDDPNRSIRRVRLLDRQPVSPSDAPGAADRHGTQCGTNRDALGTMILTWGHRKRSGCEPPDTRDQAPH